MMDVIIFIYSYGKRKRSIYHVYNDHVKGPKNSNHHLVIIDMT